MNDQKRYTEVFSSYDVRKKIAFMLMMSGFMLDKCSFENPHVNPMSKTALTAIRKGWAWIYGENNITKTIVGNEHKINKRLLADWNSKGGVKEIKTIRIKNTPKNVVLSFS